MPSKLHYSEIFFVHGFFNLFYFYVKNLQSDAEKYLF